jgi:hypothetical protein
LVTFVCVSFGSSAVDLHFGFKSASKSLSEPFRKLGLAGVDFGTILFELLFELSVEVLFEVFVEVFVELLAPFFDFVVDFWPSSKSLSSSSVPFYNQREKKSTRTSFIICLFMPKSWVTKDEGRY